MNIPNALTIMRIFMVPAFIWEVLEGHLAMGLWLFVLAAFTDGLDGFIATRFNQKTRVGAFLDPLADKILLVSAFIILTHQGWIEYWVTLLVVGRDLLIIGGALLYQILTNALHMEPLWISKVNTVVQLLFVFCTLLERLQGWPRQEMLVIMSLVVCLTTVISGVAYVFKWTRRASDGRT